MGSGVVKQGWAFGLALACFGVMAPYPGGADPVRLAQAVAADELPPQEIIAAVRETGLNPRSRPIRQGRYYVLHALDPRNIEMRVVVDPHFGDVLSVTPARAAVYSAPRYDSGPRIINIPPNFVRGDVTQSYGRAAPPPADLEADDEAAAPYPRAEPSPPPSRPPRAVLRAPPQRSDQSAAPSDGPTPIRPLPPLPGSTRFTPPPEPRTTASAPPVVDAAAGSGSDPRARAARMPSKLIQFPPPASPTAAAEKPSAED